MSNERFALNLGLVLGMAGGIFAQFNAPLDRNPLVTFGYMLVGAVFWMGVISMAQWRR